MKKIIIALIFVSIAAIGYVAWPNLVRLVIDMPGERPAVQLQSYSSPDKKSVARVWFKMMHSDDHIDTYDSWVEVGPVAALRGTRVMTLFSSTCISCVWDGNSVLNIYYWGDLDGDYPAKLAIDTVEVRLKSINGQPGYNPSHRH